MARPARADPLAVRAAIGDHAMVQFENEAQRGMLRALGPTIGQLRRLFAQRLRSR